MVEDAKKLVEAGAIGVLAEATTAETAEALVNAIDVPVIGCGAGPACHGQIVVTQDILGLTDWQPSFASSEGQIGNSIQAVVEQWCEKVRRREMEHPYAMKDGEAEQLED